jgi:hypothetical protein
LAGLGAIVALISIQFLSLWWLAVIGSVTCTVLAGLLERENFRLRDEIDRLNSELARYNTEQSPDLATQPSLARQPSDAFLQRLRQLGVQKPAS